MKALLAVTLPFFPYELATLEPIEGWPAEYFVTVKPGLCPRAPKGRVLTQDLAEILWPAPGG